MSIDEMIAVLQAAKAGKKIQFRRYSDAERTGWMDCVNPPDWNFEEREYRVKPEPREGWIDPARIHGRSWACDKANCIKVREVLE